MRALFATGRAVLGGFFVLAGINKLTNYGGTTIYMEDAGLPGALLPLVIALEFLGGLIVATGRPARLLPWAAIALAGFSVLTNLVFHRFWEFDGQLGQLELSLFFKNLAIAGGLLMAAGAVMTRKTGVRA